MKRASMLGLIIIALAQQVIAQEQFIIKGNFSSVKDGTKILLSYQNDERSVQDSAIVKKGTFTIKGKIAYPGKAMLQMISDETDGGGKRAPMVSGAGMGARAFNMMMGSDAQDLFIDKGTTVVEGESDMKTAVIKGGKTQAEYMLLQSQLDVLEKKMAPLSEQMRKLMDQNDSKARDALFPKLRAIRMEMTETEKKFIKNNPDSYVSLDMVAQAMTKDPSYEVLYAGLSDRLKNTPVGKKLGEQVAISNRTAPGKPAIPFTQNDTKGNAVSLSSFKGKFVLVDFWASWCKPCREENPNLVKAYNQFKGKNFEIVGISLDDKKEPWLAAIQKDGLSWIHLSDLKGWKNSVAVSYNINAIPQNFLVDPSGNIVAKNLHGKELFKKLEEVLGQVANKTSETSEFRRVSPVTNH